MDYVRLGQSGLKVSRIAMGCMSFADANVALLRAEAGRDPINQELTDLVAQLSTGARRSDSIPSAAGPRPAGDESPLTA